MDNTAMARRLSMDDFSRLGSESIHVQYGTIETSFPPHEHSFLELFIIISGQATHAIDGREFPIGAGSIYAVKRGSIHAFEKVRNLTLWNIMLGECYPPLSDRSLRLLPGYQALFVIDPVLPSADRSNPFVLLDTASLSYLESIVRDLHRELLQANPGWEVASRAGFFLLAAHLGREYGKQHELGKADGATTGEKDVKNGKSDFAFRLARTLAFMERNLQRQITISELAKEAAMSERHYSRKFTQAYGGPPGTFVAGLRLDRARLLLESGDLVLEKIAELTGHTDAAHLCRAFMNTYGVTPSKFRNLIQLRPLNTE